MTGEEAVIALCSAAFNGGDVRRMPRVGCHKSSVARRGKDSREEAREIFQISSCHDLKKDTARMYEISRRKEG